MALRAFAVAAAVLGLVAAALAAWAVVDVLLVLFGAVLFAVLLRSVAVFISAHARMSQGSALALFLAASGILIGVGVWLLAPGVSEQAAELGDALPQTLAAARRYLEGVGWGRSIIDHLGAGSVGGGLVHRMTAVASGALDALANVLVVFFVGLYLAMDPQWYIQGFLQLVPHPHRRRAAAVLDETGGALAHWLAGKLTGMAFVAVVTITGLLLLGVPMPVVLGLLAGVLDFIPNIGPIIALVPAALVALAREPMLAVWVAVLYTAVQFVESYILVPAIQKRAVSLPPAVTISAQVILGVLLGPGGLVFATPLTVTAIVAVRMLYVEDVLGAGGRHTVESGEENQTDGKRRR